MKRMFDLVVAAMGGLLLLPAMIVIALLVRMRLGSPIVFKQVRPGLHGKPFLLYKFRTMIDLRDANGVLLPDEARLSPFGVFLRKYSLDELPQLLNVIRGELSLVGPRPLLMEYLPRYTTEQARRHEVRPGLTGLAQVKGRNAIEWETKFRYDVWYVDNRTFWLDLCLLWQTLAQIVRPKGINAPGHATMPAFVGKQDKSEEVAAGREIPSWE